MMNHRVELDFPASIERQFPESFGPAWAATQDVLATLEGVDFSPLARHSRGLMGYEWSSYHRCNVVRAVRVASALSAIGLPRARVLDFGAYFGNFSLMARRLGFAVDAVDSYRAYAPAMDRVQSLLRAAGVTALDFEDAGYGLEALPDASFDAVLCLGVIEHIPHSPKRMLEALDRVLKPAGLLILDTPNLGYLYKRQALARGASIFPPIADQYLTEPPFEGHHREYTTTEIRWMLEQIGHIDLTTDTFNYSVFGLKELTAQDVADQDAMAADPSLRELIMTTSRKPAATRVSARGRE